MVCWHWWITFCLWVPLLHIYLRFCLRNGKNVMDTVEKILPETEMFMLTRKSQVSQILVPPDVSHFFSSSLRSCFPNTCLHRDWEGVHSKMPLENCRGGSALPFLFHPSVYRRKGKLKYAFLIRYGELGQRMNSCHLTTLNNTSTYPRHVVGRCWFLRFI